MTNTKEQMESSGTTIGMSATLKHMGVISRMDCLELEMLLRDAAAAMEAKVLRSDFRGCGSGAGKEGVLMLAGGRLSVHTWPEHNYSELDVFVRIGGGHRGMASIESAFSVYKANDPNGKYKQTLDIKVLEEFRRTESTLSKLKPFLMTEEVISGVKTGECHEQ